MAQRGWQDEILEKVPSGIDIGQLEECLRLTPTERLERMRQFLEELEALKREARRGGGLPQAH